MRTRDLRSLISLGAILGLLVAIFSALEFYDTALRGICTVNSFFSCAVVDQSGKTSTLGIPDYLWGIGGFVLILIVAGIAEARAKVPAWTYLLALIATGGVLLSGYFVYVEVVEIHALCLVCAVDYCFGLLVWGGALALVRRAGKGTDDGPERPRGAPSG